MRVVGTFHPSSSISRSLKCALTLDSGLEFLVVAKTDKLEVFSLQPEGLKRECGLDVWGRIVGLQDVPAKVRLIVLVAYSYSDMSGLVGGRAVAYPGHD